MRITSLEPSGLICPGELVASTLRCGMDVCQFGEAALEAWGAKTPGQSTKFYSMASLCFPAPVGGARRSGNHVVCLIYAHRDSFEDLVFNPKTAPRA